MYILYGVELVALLKSMNITVITLCFITIRRLCYIYTARMIRAIFG